MENIQEEVGLTSSGHGPFLFCSTTQTFLPKNLTVLSLYISAEFCEDIVRATPNTAPACHRFHQPDRALL